MDKEQVLDYNRKLTQASSSELVVITYELMERNLEEATRYFQEAEFLRYRSAIKKARALLGELITSLDLQYDISAQLLRIYLFMNRSLLRADLRNDMTEIPRICEMIRKLRESFVEVAKSDRSGPVMENAQQVYVGMTYSKGSLNEDIYTANMNRGYKV